MTEYRDYIKSNILEMEKLRTLYKVYAPPYLKFEGDQSLMRVITILNTHLEMVENDNREHPF